MASFIDQAVQSWLFRKEDKRVSYREMTAVLERTKVLILGAAGRQFHNFTVVFRKVEFS